MLQSTGTSLEWRYRCNFVDTEKEVVVLDELAKNFSPFLFEASVCLSFGIKVTIWNMLTPINLVETNHSLIDGLELEEVCAQRYWLSWCNC